MTYCIASSSNHGIVFCSDSRTNAGPDMLSLYSKMHVFQPDDTRFFCLLSAGNLATTQSIIAQIEMDLEIPDRISLRSCNTMIEAARYIAQLGRAEQLSALEATGSSGVDTSASLILGGQIANGKHGIYLIYSAGNFIADSDETPFLQIGESKYGKPILDRILSRKTSLEDAARCAIVSMDSTIKSNATVGPPIEVLVYQANTFDSNHYFKLSEDDQYLRDIKRSWNDVLRSGFLSLPRFDWAQRTQRSQEIDPDPLLEPVSPMPASASPPKKPSV